MSRVAVVAQRVEMRAPAEWRTTRMRFSSGGNEHSAAPTDAELSAPTPALPTSHLLSWPLAQGYATS